MQFVVIEDSKGGSTEIEIHRTSCPNYLELDEDITSVVWHGPYEHYQDARRVAENLAQEKGIGYRNASCCDSESGG
jgi:hypothetical protein